MFYGYFLCHDHHGMDALHCQCKESFLIKDEKKPSEAVITSKRSKRLEIDLLRIQQNTVPGSKKKLTRMEQREGFIRHLLDLFLTEYTPATAEEVGDERDDEQMRWDVGWKVAYSDDEESQGDESEDDVWHPGDDYDDVLA
jgi:hypothetical protein